MYLKKSVYQKHDIFNTVYECSADYDFMIRILKDENLKFLYIPYLITNMRTGGISNKNITSIIKKSLEDYRIIRSNKIGGLPCLLKKNFNKLNQFRIFDRRMI